MRSWQEFEKSFFVFVEQFHSIESKSVAWKGSLSSYFPNFCLNIRKKKKKKIRRICQTPRNRLNLIYLKAYPSPQSLKEQSWKKSSIFCGGVECPQTETKKTGVEKLWSTNSHPLEVEARRGDRGLLQKLLCLLHCSSRWLYIIEFKDRLFQRLEFFSNDETLKWKT